MLGRWRLQRLSRLRAHRTLSALARAEPRREWDAMKNVWHKCRGCGGFLGLLGDGLPPHYPPGAVAHSKPREDINVRPVQCPLWHQMTAEQLTRLHESDPPIEGPSSMRPVPLES
jgi:hypothetical protein